MMQVLIPSSEATTPAIISAGYTHTCALDERGPRCWGNNGGQRAKVPTLKNPSMISAGLFQSCAIDDDGAKCWGFDYGTMVPPLKNPLTIQAAIYDENYVCAIDDDGVHCWGGRTDVKDPIIEVPVL